MPLIPRYLQIRHPRVVHSEGGGWAPEQHTGTLTDGRSFYFRMRSGCAQLHIGQPGEQLPVINPDWSSDAFDAAVKTGKVYAVPLWRQPVGEIVVYEDDPMRGAFLNDADRDVAFGRCLDRIDAMERVADGLEP